jgi:hypothetical protein
MAQHGGTLHLPVLATFTVSFMRVEVLQQTLKYCVGDFVADSHARLYLWLACSVKK